MWLHATRGGCCNSCTPIRSSVKEGYSCWLTYRPELQEVQRQYKSAINTARVRTTTVFSLNLFYSHFHYDESLPFLSRVWWLPEVLPYLAYHKSTLFTVCVTDTNLQSVIDWHICNAHSFLKLKDTANALQYPETPFVYTRPAWVKLYCPLGQSCLSKLITRENNENTNDQSTAL